MDKNQFIEFNQHLQDAAVNAKRIIDLLNMKEENPPTHPLQDSIKRLYDEHVERLVESMANIIAISGIDDMIKDSLFNNN